MLFYQKKEDPVFFLFSGLRVSNESVFYSGAYLDTQKCPISPRKLGNSETRFFQLRKPVFGEQCVNTWKNPSKAEGIEVAESERTAVRSIPVALKRAIEACVTVRYESTPCSLSQDFGSDVESQLKHVEELQDLKRAQPTSKCSA